MNLKPKPPVTAYHVNRFNHATGQWATCWYAESETQAHRAVRDLAERDEALGTDRPRYAVVATTVTEYVEAEEADLATDVRDGFVKVWGDFNWSSGEAQSIHIPGSRRGVQSSVQKAFAARVRREAAKRSLKVTVRIAASQDVAHIRILTGGPFGLQAKEVIAS
jgi:hypothetical protein